MSTAIIVVATLVGGSLSMTSLVVDTVPHNAEYGKKLAKLERKP